MDILSRRFAGFMGVGHKASRAAKDLHWPRLMAYIGLIVFSGEAAGSLESILRHYFSHADISIVPCIRRWIDIPEDQQTRLGTANCTLGTDFLLGSSMPDQTGKFRIRIANLSWRRFNDFLPSGNLLGELRTLVNFVLRSRLDFDVELRLRSEEIPEWRLEESNECRLGWSTWAGEGGDGVVVLEVGR
jgi:type VI secretion system protein ImpH